MAGNSKRDQCWEEKRRKFLEKRNGAPGAAPGGPSRAPPVTPAAPAAAPAAPFARRLPQDSLDMCIAERPLSGAGSARPASGAESHSSGRGGYPERNLGGLSAPLPGMGAAPSYAGNPSYQAYQPDPPAQPSYQGYDQGPGRSAQPSYRDQGPPQSSYRDQGPSQPSYRDQGPPQQSYRDQGPSYAGNSSYQAPTQQSYRDQGPPQQSYRDQGPAQPSYRDQGGSRQPAQRSMADQRPTDAQAPYSTPAHSAPREAPWEHQDTATKPHESYAHRHVQGRAAHDPRDAPWNHQHESSAKHSSYADRATSHGAPWDRDPAPQVAMRAERPPLAQGQDGKQAYADALRAQMRETEERKQRGRARDRTPEPGGGAQMRHQSPRYPGVSPQKRTAQLEYAAALQQQMAESASRKQAQRDVTRHPGHVPADRERHGAATQQAQHGAQSSGYGAPEPVRQPPGGYSNGLW